MNRKIIGSVEPKCVYCKHGSMASDGEHVLCPKKGVYDKNSFCKKFEYDPFKHTPIKKPVLQQFSPEDFEI